MPAPIPPQTSKQAKRAYQKSGKVFKYTASQERAATRRNAKEEFARKLKEKEQKSKINKRKREEKEAKEREAKRQLVAKGFLSEDALLPKVPASQPRLNLFLRQPSRRVAKRQSTPPACDEEHEEETKAESDNEDTLVNESRPTVPPPVVNDQDLEELFATSTSQKGDIVTEEINEQGVASRRRSAEHSQHPQHPAPEMNKEDLEAQLGCPLSQVLSDFEICEDPLSDSEQPPPPTPSPRKRKLTDDGFATPSKSARSALSEMSPAKVFIRSQEKPDKTSAPSLIRQILSPRHERPTSSQIADETLAMISTQDIADDIDFSPTKENTEPRQFVSSQMKSCGQLQSKLASGKAMEEEKSMMDEESLDELLDLDDLEDYEDEDLTDAFWAGLSTQPAKNTAVSTFGSPKKARVMASTTLQMPATSPRPSPVANLITKLKAVTPSKQTPASAYIGQPLEKTSQSFEFSDSISDTDLAALDMEMLVTAEKSNTRSASAVPSLSSTVASTSMAPPQHLTPRRLTTSTRPILTPKSRIPASPLRNQLPPASQSFGMDDVLDDDLLALVDAVDTAGQPSSTTKKSFKKGRTLPWDNRPENWDAMMAEDEENREVAAKGKGRCDA